MPNHLDDTVCREIVEGSHDAIIFADRQGIIRLWNLGAEAMFGHRAEKAIGARFTPVGTITT